MDVGLSRPFSNGRQTAGVSVLRSMLDSGISKIFNIDVPGTEFFGSVLVMFLHGHLVHVGRSQ